MMTLRKIEKGILGIVQQKHQDFEKDSESKSASSIDGYLGRALDYPEIKALRRDHALEKLEMERKFALDRRESWLPKTIWMVLVPIVTSLIISIAIPYISNSLRD